MTSRRLGSQDGFTMMEVLVAMVLTTFVLGVATAAFSALWGEHRTTTEHNEAQDEVRIAVDRLSRDLRNLASPSTLTAVTENRPHAIELAEPYQLVFRTVDEIPLPAGSANLANVMRVRYCLDVSKPQNAVLRMKTQRWKTATPPPMPPTTGPCQQGKAAWDDSRVLADHIVNATNVAAPRPFFAYDSANVEKITRVRTDVYIDPTPRRRPVEARLASGVYLRNQNQFPVANFTATPLAGGSVRLDGSTSVEPEGQPLTYCWYVNPPTPLPSCTTNPKPASYVGEGVVFTLPGPVPNGTTIALRASDPAGLFEDKVVTYP